MAATVIIPVHNARQALERCLASLDRHSPNAPVVLIDDASTDAGIPPMVHNWSGTHKARRLITQPRNEGFVATVNRGMAACQGDVVLLNSDTQVTPGWLEALERCLDSAPDIATATPWSNNGEIVSWPDLCQAGPVPENLEPLSRAIAQAASGDYPNLPTAVGFCMAISRRALDELGQFDEATFGRGYGEENDFSCRAAAAGWRNVLCHGAYVAHEGGQSFGPLGLKPDEASMQRLLSLHPGYLERVMQFIEKDPLKGHRLAIADVLREQGG